MKPSIYQMDDVPRYLIRNYLSRLASEYRYLARQLPDMEPALQSYYHGQLEATLNAIKQMASQMSSWKWARKNTVTIFG